MTNISLIKKIFASTIIATSLMFTACAKPTTMAPKLDNHAVAQETNVQKNIATNSITKTTFTKSELQAMTSRLARHATRVRKAGQQLCKNMGRQPTDCIYDFKIKNEANLNAYADGKSIFVTPVMMHFAKSDNTLGMVLSHEYAHNIMGHVASKKSNMSIGMIAGLGLDLLAKSQGIETKGELTKLGAGLAGRAFSPEFESEADYVGLYVMALAKYDINQAANLWRNMTAADSKGAFMDSTHPSNPKRYVLLNNTKDEIRGKQKRKELLIPNKLPKK